MKYTDLLLIDDDRDDQVFFTDSIHQLSMQLRCMVMSEADKALEELKKETFRPDIIFLDLNMPRMNGEDFLIAIKGLDALKAIPIVIFTTSCEWETIARMKELGAYDYLVKPITIRDLVKKLSEILSPMPEWLTLKTL